MKRLEKPLFYIFIFSVPFQTRYILWRWAEPFNEWTTGFIYGSDVLIFLLVLFWLTRVVKRKGKIVFNKFDWLLAAFFIISTISIFNARLVEVSVFRLLKLAEFGLFYFYLKSNIGGIFTLNKTAAIIVASGLFQAVIGIAQYLKQESLGLKIFGESPIGPDIPNVAMFLADGQKYLRVYGTTPHPNVLAAWLFLAIFAFYLWYLGRGDKSSKIPLIAYVVILFGFFLTFSRVIVGLWLVTAAVGFLVAGSRRKRLAPLVVATLAAITIFALIFWPQVSSRLQLSLDEEAVSQRAFYNRAASSIARANPILGVGIGQFVPTLISQLKHYPAYFYQPVHNIYLLIASETGLIGLGVFLAFAFSIFRSAVKKSAADWFSTLPFLILPFAFLLFGLFDHFLWTLQQGSLMLWLTLAFCSSFEHNKIPAGHTPA